MPYLTPWGEERPTKKELKAGAVMLARLHGVTDEALTQTFEPGQRVHTPMGAGSVVKMIGHLFVIVDLDENRVLGAHAQVEFAITTVSKEVPAP